MEGIQMQTDRRTRALSSFMCLVMLCCLIYSAVAASAPKYPSTGNTQITGKSVTIDVSNADQGYIMVKHKGSKYRLKVAITTSAGTIYYDLNGDGAFEVYPLTNGDGKYQITVYQNESTKASSTAYATLLAKSISVKMASPTVPYLYPNQYVWYTNRSEAVKKSQELCAGLTTDREKLDAIYEFVGTQVMYDYMKAVAVQSQKDYLPDVDSTLSSKTGICFDYAALLACMLRVQGIPTRMVKGNLNAAGSVQVHAWNNVYVDGKWVLKDATLYGKQQKASEYIPQKLY